MATAKAYPTDPPKTRRPYNTLFLLIFLALSALLTCSCAWR